MNAWAATVTIIIIIQVFRMPQIGYSATSTDLSNKEEFGYYLRVVPSDEWQARAMLEIVKHFGWTYIAVVYSAGGCVWDCGQTMCAITADALRVPIAAGDHLWAGILALIRPSVR